RPRSAVAERELLSTPAVRRERAALHGDGEGLRLRQSPKGEPGQSAHVTAPSPGVQVTGRVKPDGPLALVPDRTVNRLTLRGTHDEGVEEEIDLRGGDRSIAEITQQVVAGGGSRAIDLVPQPRKQGLGQGVVARKVPGALFVDDDGDIRSKRSSDIHPGPPRLTKSGEGVPDLLR